MIIGCHPPASFGWACMPKITHSTVFAEHLSFTSTWTTLSGQSPLCTAMDSNQTGISTKEKSANWLRQLRASCTITKGELITLLDEHLVALISIKKNEAMEAMLLKLFEFFIGVLSHTGRLNPGVVGAACTGHQAQKLAPTEPSVTIMSLWGHLTKTERYMKEGDKLLDVECFLGRALRNRLNYGKLLGFEHKLMVNGALVPRQTGLALEANAKALLKLDQSMPTSSTATSAPSEPPSELPPPELTQTVSADADLPRPGSVHDGVAGPLAQADIPDVHGAPVVPEAHAPVAQAHEAVSHGDPDAPQQALPEAVPHGVPVAHQALPQAVHHGVPDAPQQAPPEAVHHEAHPEAAPHGALLGHQQALPEAVPHGAGVPDAHQQALSEAVHHPVAQQAFLEAVPHGAHHEAALHGVPVGPQQALPEAVPHGIPSTNQKAPATSGAKSWGFKMQQPTSSRSFIDLDEGDDSHLQGAQALLLKMVHQKYPELGQPRASDSVDPPKFRNRIISVDEHALTAQVLTISGEICVDLVPGPGEWAVAPVGSELVLCPIPNRMLAQTLRSSLGASTPQKRKATEDHQVSGQRPLKRGVSSKQEIVEDTGCKEELSDSAMVDKAKKHFSVMYYITGPKRLRPAVAIRKKGCPGANDQLGSAQIPEGVGKEEAVAMAWKVCGWIVEELQQEADISDLLEMGVQHLHSQH